VAKQQRRYHVLAKKREDIVRLLFAREDAGPRYLHFGLLYAISSCRSKVSRGKACGGLPG